MRGVEILASRVEEQINFSGGWLFLKCNSNRKMVNWTRYGTQKRILLIGVTAAALT
jgi:hypothetical protein